MYLIETVTKTSIFATACPYVPGQNGEIAAKTAGNALETTSGGLSPQPWSR